MKRMLLPAALLACAAAACAPAPSNTANTTATNTNAANANAANTNAASTAGVSESDLLAKEHEIYDNFKKKDTAAFGALLTDDFIYVGPEPAVHDKADTLKIIGSNDLNDISITDSRLVRIDNDAAVLVYNSHSAGNGPDKKPFDYEARESSVWVNRGGKWIAIFHQDCYVRPMPPPPPASANTNASANSNKPAATTSPAAAATPGADAAANEKMVWDAIKRHDATAFGNFLAEDAVEVEPDKVYTKSESVSTVSSLPFLASATLSDFKTMKIDDDASIVTYTVKGIGPDHKPFTEHHSTVWANRNGRWQAVFHHGTPVGPPPPPPSSSSANANATKPSSSANANKPSSSANANK